MFFGQNLYFANHIKKQKIPEKMYPQLLNYECMYNVNDFESFFFNWTITFYVFFIACVQNCYCFRLLSYICIPLCFYFP